MQNNNCEAIVMGGSWGGLEALISILKGIPSDFPIPFIVVLHRMKYVKSELDSIIRNKTALTVKEIEEKEIIKQGVIYVAPADYHVLIEEDRSFSLSSEGPVNFSRPSIDVTFKSASIVFRQKLTGIILTGANKDGSDGLQRIEENGGTAIIQDPGEAAMADMPLSAIACTKKPFIFRLDQIKNFLLNYEY